MRPGGLVRLARARLNPPQDAFVPRQQLPEMKRLWQIIVGPHLEADDAVDGLAAAGQDDDADAGLVAQRACQGQPVLTRQHQIQNDEIDMRLTEHPAHAAAVAGRRDAVAFAGQVFLDDIADLLLVIDHQDMTVIAHAQRTCPA